MAAFPSITNDSFGGGIFIVDFPEISLPRSIRFWLLLIFLIPSLLCSLILLYHLIVDRTLRKPLNNHVTIVLLFNCLLLQITDIPLDLNFLRVGSIQPQVPMMCLLRWFMDIGMFNLRGFLMAWASIEQHILVFHDQWLSTPKKRFFVHYLPLISIIIYCFTLYIIVIFFSPCQNVYIYTQEWCSIPCYLITSQFNLYSTVFNSFLPTCCVFIFSISLCVRVIRQKRRLQQRINWRKCRKMFVQFITTAIVFLLLDIPAAALSLAAILETQSYTSIQAGLYTYFLRTLICLFMPFVFLGSVSEAQEKIRRTLHLNTSATAVVPAIFSIR
jgi:hypothetical protein